MKLSPGPGFRDGFIFDGPAGPPRRHNPLPFCYESTGVETRFTNGLDPEPRSRNVFAFHRPETLAPPLVGEERG